MHSDTTTVALVTGASSGIGREFARQLAKKGHSILAISNQQEELILTAAELATLNPASSQAAWSISTASIIANTLRWATIKAISPVPVPTSNTLKAPSTGHQAPSNTPSVPTFIAAILLRTANCLNLKTDSLIVQ